MSRALDEKLNSRRDERSFVERLLPWLFPAILLQGLLGLIGGWAVPLMGGDRDANHRPMKIVLIESAPAEAEPPKPPPEEPEDKIVQPDGQIVEIAKPLDPQIPDQSDYLAEWNNQVDRETRSEQYAVNPEVVSDQFSRETQVGGDTLPDVHAERPATGAMVGNDRFDPGRDGNFASLPSPYSVTNAPGLDAPVPSTPGSRDWKGAPQNDLLNEQIGDRTALNTREYLYASYLNRIRRLVNFYWKQNVDNLPSSVRFAKSSYDTGVDVVLTSEGGLDTLEVTHESGSNPLDDCVVRAFKLAGPFPNPPEGLIERDGRVYLPDFTFQVTLGHAQLRYDGVDPRAGVQFPGLLKSPY